MANISSINGNPIVVGTSGIVDNSITGAKIASNTIPDAKLAQSGGVVEKTDSIAGGYYKDLELAQYGWTGTNRAIIKAKMKFKAGGYIRVSNVPASTHFFITSVGGVNSGWIEADVEYSVKTDDVYQVVFGKRDNTNFSSDFAELAGVTVECLVSRTELASAELYGKNLSVLDIFSTFGAETYTGGYEIGWVGNDGTIQPSRWNLYHNVTYHNVTTDYIKTNEHDIFTLLFHSEDAYPFWAEIAYFDADKNFISRYAFADITTADYSRQVTVPENGTHYVRFSHTVKNDGSDTVTITRFPSVRGAVRYDGYYIRTSGTVNVDNLIPEKTYTCIVCDCETDTRFVISGHGGSNGRLWTFIDASGTILSQGRADESCVLKELHAPYGAKKLIVNSYIYALPEVYRYPLPFSMERELLNRIHTPNILDQGDLIAKPTVEYRNPNFQEDQNTVCTKFGLFKASDNYCITYAQNVLYDNQDNPDLSETGRMEYRYRYFKLVDGQESDVSYGIVAKKGTQYVDVDGNTQTMVGGCSYGSSVNNRVYFATAFMNDENIRDNKPCTCAVTLGDDGVSFGTIYELRLVVGGTTGIFNSLRMGGWRDNYYTSSAPSYYNGVYSWCIPTVYGFAYLESADGVTWTLLYKCVTPYPTGNEIPCIKIGNDIVFAARPNLYDHINEGNYIYVGTYSTADASMKTNYRITGNLTKPSLLRIGTNNAAALCVNRGNDYRNLAFIIVTKTNHFLEFSKWFDIYNQGTYYATIYEGGLSDLRNMSEIVLVGGNGTIANHASAFIKLHIDSGPKTIDQIPFAVA